MKIKNKMLVALFFLGMSASTYAGFGWIEDGIKDVGDTIEDTIEDGGEFFYEEVGKPFGKSYEEIYDWLECGCLGDDDEPGVGSDELVIKLEAFYMPSMDNSNLTLIDIEGSAPAFAWVPIGIEIVTFIPLYGSGIPQIPSFEGIWNNVDADSDGIYDDVEHYLIKAYPNDDQVRLAGYRFSSSVKQLVDYFENEDDEFFTAMVNYERATTCLNDATDDLNVAAIRTNIVTNMSRMKSILKMSYKAGNLFINLGRNNHLSCSKPE
jgi:hypothetical protein